VAGIVKPDGKVTYSVLPTLKAPDDEGVKPTVQVVEVLFAVCADPVNVTAVDEVSAVTTIELAFAASVLFTEVSIEKPAEDD
jgi:hypothetical protein